MNEVFRWVLIVYFATHVPITLCVDLQGLIPKIYPDNLTNLLEWYTTAFEDQLMAHPQPWFKSFLFAEGVFQLPFFFVALYGLLKKRNWLRIPSIIYGAHTSTTVWPIMAETIAFKHSSYQKTILLVLIYSPYFCMPLALAIYMAFVPTPFPHSPRRAKPL
jgi:hypothetical protein